MEPRLLDDAPSLASTYGKRAGLSVEDAEDCAAQFVARILTASPPASNAEAWLRRCARNQALSCLRARRRRLTHERRWPEMVSDSGRFLPRDCPDGAPGVEADLMRGELWARLMAALAELAPVAQQIFLRHHLSGELVQDIAASYERTPHAIEQSLYRSRKQLRAALKRRSLTEAELRQYLADCPAPMLRWHAPDAEET